ncbi:type III polyketide synthase [Rubellicoccus peritrichatus]|uniref:Type III polyketide synthase n=1 Tax=Rubellicoccus peritrichatus TaxID=3080537 RepID=A0AAQ3QTF1_9BACT|nr:type III polyketide synthase [Puniceicoccus sp. CR14]WOO39303.1 type III polyketide synthase [Puniceicoccus sp. CR14]
MSTSIFPQSQPATEESRNVMPRLLSLSTAVPSERWTQEETLARFAEHFSQYREPIAERIFRNSGIDHRNFSIKQEDFDPTVDSDELHAIYSEESLKLGSRAARQCLEQGDFSATDVDYLVVATCTGYLCPGLTARIARELGLRDDIQRADLVGMGCSGAMPSLQRANDFVRAYPDKRALVITVEISSACWYVDDTMETIVGNAICADGAAAALIGTGDSGNYPAIAQFAGLMDTGYIESVGFEFKAGKNRIILAKELRDASGPLVKTAVERLLDQTGVAWNAIDHWIIHSGGKRVLDSIDQSLGFKNNELANSRTVLRECGNMSSPTLFFVLERALRDARPGDLGVLVALGPGLSAETALIHW